MSKMEKPPGSSESIASGCSCKRAELNEKGREVFSGVRVWVIDKGCPVHGDRPGKSHKNTLH